MIEKTKYAIAVTVETEFLPEQSDAEESRYLFAYRNNFP